MHVLACSTAIWEVVLNVIILFGINVPQVNIVARELLVIRIVILLPEIGLE